MNLKTKVLSLAMASTLLYSSLALAYADTSSHWAAKYIDDLSSKGIVSGYPDGSFRPEGLISREEAAQMISNYVGGSGGSSSIPADSAGRWSAEAIGNLLDKKIIDGYEDGSFRPENKITRAEFATIGYKMLKSQGNLGDSAVPFPDLSAHWAKTAVESLAGAGFVNGYGDGSFRPEGSITRAEAVTIMSKIDHGGDFSSAYDVMRSDVDPMPTIRQRMEESIMASGQVPIERIADIAYWNYPANLAGAHATVEKDCLSVPFVNPESGKEMTLKLPFHRLLNVLSPDFVRSTGDKSLIDKMESGNASVKRVALTFDDGPKPGVTAQILDALKRHGAKATFFVQGQHVASYPDIVRRQVAEGHELGNHSWNHPLLTSQTDSRSVHQQILGTEMALYQATGQFSSFLRPPGAVFDSEVVYLSGMPIILLSVNTDDWQNATGGESYDKLVGAGVESGDIVLMHDIQKTADVLDDMLSYLESQGFEFVTVSELYGYELYPHNAYYGKDWVEKY